jgi:hypothetical protein
MYSAIIDRNTVPIANIYFKLCHRDKPDKENGFEDKLLTNKYQLKVAEELTKRINKLCSGYKSSHKSDETATFVPYYDSIIDKKHKKNLCEVKTNPMILSKIR